MKDEQIEECIRVAEEIGKEICTGEPSTSLLAERWKKEHAERYQEMLHRPDWPQENVFHKTQDTEEALRAVGKRIGPIRRFGFRPWSVAASLLLVVGLAAGSFWYVWHGEALRPESEKLPLRTEPPAVLLESQDKAPRAIGADCFRVQGNVLACTREGALKDVMMPLKEDGGFNKLSVSKGGSYRLTLEEGTEIQVNAASELSFPTRFTRTDRRVELNGEACFKVNTNREAPFKVLLGDLIVVVTGTTFNVEAYEDKPEIIVSLLEGSIEVCDREKRLAVLSPGERIVYRKATKQCTLEPGDWAADADWVEGRFVFRYATAEEIAGELSRWYNLTIRVRKGASGQRYSGILSRKQSPEEILDLLYLTNELEFEIDSPAKERKSK